MWKTASLTALLPALFESTRLATTVKKSHISDCEKIRPLAAHESAIALMAVIHLPYALTVASERLPTNSTAFLRTSGSSILSMSRQELRRLGFDADWALSSASAIGEKLAG